MREHEPRIVRQRQADQGVKSGEDQGESRHLQPLIAGAPRQSLLESLAPAECQPGQHVNSADKQVCQHRPALDAGVAAGLRLPFRI